MQSKALRKVCVMLAMAVPGTGIGFFTSIPIAELIEYAEIIKDITDNPEQE